MRNRQESRTGFGSLEFGIPARYNKNVLNTQMNADAVRAGRRLGERRKRIPTDAEDFRIHAGESASNGSRSTSAEKRAVSKRFETAFVAEKPEGRAFSGSSGFE